MYKNEHYVILYLLVVADAIPEGHGVVDNVVVGEAGSFGIASCALKYQTNSNS